MHIASLKEVVSAEEWQLRCDLAACYRLVAAVRLERPGVHPYQRALRGARR